LKDLLNRGIDLKYVAHRSRCFVGQRNEKIE